MKGVLDSIVLRMLRRVDYLPVHNPPNINVLTALCSFERVTLQGCCALSYSLVSLAFATRWNYYIQYICVHVQTQTCLCCIYVIYFSFSRYFHHDELYNLMNKDTINLLLIQPIIFGSSRDGECEYFHISKVQSQDVAQHLKKKLVNILRKKDH